MDLTDLSYFATVSLAGALARSCRRGLPEGWRLRLEAAGPELPSGRWVWLHAVSVGELLLADGLLGRLRQAGHRVHLTTGTPAGLELLHRRLGGWDQGTGRVSGGAFPLDDPAGLETFLAHPPGAFVALETELWPGLLEALEQRGIPRCIVNGRLTGKSLQRGGPWLRRAASRLSLVAARDAESLAAFRALGAPHAELGGNLKADLPDPVPLHAGWEALRDAWAGAPILVAGNTLEGEEDLILDAWIAARRSMPDLRLILAPRQPRRFETVAASFLARGLAFARASAPWAGMPDWGPKDALLLDTLGELPAAYALGTVALVAGGWTAAGGHNPLEPARFGVPTLLGPGHANFEDLVPPLLASGQAEVVPSEALPAKLLATLARARGEGRGPVGLPPELAGALERTWSLLAPQLPVPG